MLNKKTIKEIEDYGITSGVLALKRSDGTSYNVPVDRLPGETMSQAIVRLMKEHGEIDE